jgi:hypothetical protein
VGKQARAQSTAASKLFEASGRMHGAGGRAARREGDEAQNMMTMERPPLDIKHRRCFKALGSFLDNLPDLVLGMAYSAYRVPAEIRR